VRGLRECGKRDGIAIEFGQGDGEAARFAQHGGGDVVGDLLAFDADAAREPPHDRVVEQQDLDDALQQIDEVVVTADVGELVCEQRFQQVRRHAQR
jgi:hypothetical protein